MGKKTKKFRQVCFCLFISAEIFNDFYTAKLLFGNDTWLFGTAFLQAFYTEFDMDLKRIGFGKKTLLDLNKIDQVSKENFLNKGNKGLTSFYIFLIFLNLAHKRLFISFSFKCEQYYVSGNGLFTFKYKYVSLRCPWTSHSVFKAFWTLFLFETLKNYLLFFLFSQKGLKNFI